MTSLPTHRLNFFGVAALLLGLGAGCDKPKAPVLPGDGGTPPPTSPPASRVNLLAPTGLAPGPLQRPPHPAMATSQHGYAALQALSAEAPPPQGLVTLASAMAKLGGAGDDAERASRTLFLQVFKTAGDDTARAEAAAGVMLSLVLDPDPTGYTARLTDAYGMQLYAASAKGTGRFVAGARAVVQAAAGRLGDARASAKRLAEGDVEDAWSRMLEGVARTTLGDRGAAVAAFKVAITAAGQSLPRAYVERATVLLQLGDTAGARADAETALEVNPACSRCKLLRAQAKALGGDTQLITAGLAELSALSGAGLPAHWTVEALTTAAVTEAAQGHVEAAEGLSEKLRTFKEYAPEAALASGLTAFAAHQNDAALVALDKAVKTLPQGSLRAAGLRALAQAAQASGSTARALEALKGLDLEAGFDAASAELAATALMSMHDDAAARDELLRAHVLDPYSAARAKAAARPAQPGGAASSTKAAQMWKLLGGGAAAEAMVIAKALSAADKRNPYPAYAMMMCQRALDQNAEIGEVAPKDVIVDAIEAVKRVGKVPPHLMFHASARKELINGLDEGARNVVLEHLKKFTQDPNAAVLALAQEAVLRPAPKARKTAPESDIH